MNHRSLDDMLTAVLSTGAPGESVHNRMLDAIRTGAPEIRTRRPLRTSVGISAALLILLVIGVAAAALLANRADESEPPNVVAAAVNLLNPPAPGTVRHVTSTAFVAYPSIDDPSTVRGESWERVNEDGSTIQVVVVYGDDGEVMARAIEVDGEIWSDLEGQVHPPDRPVAVPPQVVAGMSALSMNSPEEFLAQLRTELEFDYTTHRVADSGNYVISADITDDMADGEDDEDELAQFESEAGVEVERIVFEIELSDSLDRVVRREFSIITPSGERVSFNRIEFSGWEDVDASEVDPAVFSTEIPMTSTTAE